LSTQPKIFWLIPYISIKFVKKQTFFCGEGVSENVGGVKKCMPWGWLYYRKLGIKFCLKDSSVQTIYFLGLSSVICLAPCLPWVRWNSFIWQG